jgi:two-component system, OmpR family, sensor histidine kinase BaeS
VSVAGRVVLAVALTAIFSVSLTGYLSYRAASERVPRAFGMAMMHGAGAATRPEGRAHEAMMASRGLLAELQGVTVRAAALALAVALALGALVALRTTRPLLELADVTRRYGAGERSARAPARGRDEVAALARVFNDTADRLQREEEARRRLTADVAHELRTPLTVLRSELEAMEDGLMEADPAALLGQVELLTRLVGDLRLLSQAEGGELRLEHVEVDLDDEARAAVRSFAARAAEAGVRLEVHADPVRVRGDPDRLRQVVNALLDNALRHGARSRIEIALRRQGSDAVLEVADDGPGIPEEQLPLVFDRFYRGDAARGRETGGSGLGLAIVAAIVGLHGGRAAAERVAAGGARLRVTLPALPDRGAAGGGVRRGDLRPE